MNRFWLFLILFSFSLSSCVQTTLAWAKLEPKGAVAEPALLFGSRPAGEEAKRSDVFPEYAELLQAHVYGYLPEHSQTKVLSKKILNEAALDGKARLEEWRIEVEAGFTADATLAKTNRGQFTLVVLIPNQVTGPVPVVMMETFCPSSSTIPLEGVTGSDRAEEGGIFNGLATYIFGRYICSPPLDMILEHGYSIATIYPGELFPDAQVRGPEALLRMSSGYQDDETRWGLIAAWGWTFSRMVDALEDDGRFNTEAIIAYGHSRYGKAALLATAFDTRIDGVIAHQSGTGGATLSKGNIGENVAKITKSYPYWFSRKFASYAKRTEELPLDQHFLLALLAPRPVLLGNARRDVWSDPNGAFRAAQAASPAWEQYGQPGLEQTRLVPFKPEANIAFWIRPGTHGVVKEDWPAFLQFLDAHFGPSGTNHALRARPSSDTSQAMCCLPASQHKRHP